MNSNHREQDIVSQNNNYDDNNLKFISTPFFSYEDRKSYQEYTMVQENAPATVTPSVSAMDETADLLLG